MEACVSPAEIQAAIAVFNILEPQAQKVITGLIHAFHKKQLTSQDLLDQAAKILAANPPAQ